jgi:Rrf2 family protein
LKLSTKTRYGLRACFLLALKEPDKTSSVSELAARSGLTQKYLEKILSLLAAAGIVDSFRGRDGGYALAREPSVISIGEIFRALEDNLEISDCVGGNCTDKYCPNRNILRSLYDGINDLLNKFTLRDMLNDYKCSGTEGFLERAT